MREYLENCLSEIKYLWMNESLVDFNRLENLSNRIIRVFKNGGILAFAGNGGSAAESSHLAAEFTGKCLVEHRPLPALSLSDSIAGTTAIANDFGKEDIFIRPAQAFLNEKSLLIAMSTSGKSENILKLIKDSRSRGIYTVLWTGELRHSITEDCRADEVWSVPSVTTSRIQEIHLMWGHLLAEIIEEIC